MLFYSVLLLRNFLPNLDLVIIAFDKSFVKKSIDPLEHTFFLDRVFSFNVVIFISHNLSKTIVIIDYYYLRELFQEDFLKYSLKNVFKTCNILTLVEPFSRNCSHNCLHTISKTQYVNGLIGYQLIATISINYQDSSWLRQCPWITKIGTDYQDGN